MKTPCRLAVAIVVVASATALVGCSSGTPVAGVPQPGRKFDSETSAALLDRWRPTERGIGESAESSEVGSELQYRMAGGRMNAADSQRYIDNQINYDLYGARWQMSRTAAVWPLDGHAFVRAVTLYPVNPSELRWRRAGETDWHCVAHYGHYVFLDLGRPATGEQTVTIEYQILSRVATVWQGSLDVTCSGRGGIADSCELVRDSATDEWLRRATHRVLRRGQLVLDSPPAEESPSGLHIAGSVELFRDGKLVGRAHAIFGRGHPRRTCGSRPPPDSVEWLTPDAAVDAHRSRWFMRLTSIPELAATAEFNDSQAADPPPRRVWVGSVEMPLEADPGRALR